MFQKMSVRVRLFIAFLMLAMPLLGGQIACNGSGGNDTISEQTSRAALCVSGLGSALGSDCK